MRFFVSLRTVALASVAVVSALATAKLPDGDIKIDRAQNSRTLTVRYSGVNAALVELRVNGKSMATRQVDAKSSTGETNFTLESARLEDGSNTVEVRLYDATGKLVGVQKTDVQVDRSASGPVYLARPRAWASIQGPVAISVGFQVAMKNVYVSFFIDDEFKSLRNVPPYEFLWDTTKVDNGWHEVQAWVVDESNQTFKTQRMRVYVNNPGGRTQREETPIVPRQQNEPPLETANGARATTGAGAGLKPTTAAGQATGPKAVDTANLVALASNPVEDATTVRAATKGAIAPSGVAMGPRAMRPTGGRMAGNGKHGFEMPSATAQPDRTGVVAVLPPATTVKAVPPATTPKAARLSIGYGTRLPKDGAYDVVVDGETVAFDVRPRVEAGIALTPFRHLFEHFGGKVGWEHETKTVSGSGLGSDLWFRIGESEGHVGVGTIKFERAAFIERGRAIVPMSFFSAALGFEVAYDPGTGHVLVTAAKKAGN
jgi:hypothetical protein